MIYVDTSVIVSAITNEPATEVIVAWLSRQPPGSLWTSDWVDTEVESALAIKAHGIVRPMWQPALATDILSR